MSAVAEWIQDNRESIEKGVKILGQGCEILSVTVGQVNPILEAFFKVSAELLNNPEGSEAKYLADQFESVNQELEKVQSEMEKTRLAMQRTSLNIQNFNFYTQIMNQYEMFRYIFTAKPKYKKLKIEEFLIHFEEYEREKNLDCLYDAIIGEDSEEAMLDTILATEQRSRRAVEEFCACIKKVFVLGIIALMGYTALNEDPVDDVMKKWQVRMEEVEKRMKAAVDECVNNFAEQAKTDINEKLLGKQSSVDSDFTKSILDALVQKYDWVSWSVRVFKDEDSRLCKFLFGKQAHINGRDANYFDHLSKNNIRTVVSFTAEPKILDKSQIKEQIEEVKGNVESVAECLCKSLPNCFVHVISGSVKVEEANNFDPEHFYYISHKKAHICIHSE